MIKNNISIENAKIGFRNFSGKEGKFNAAGNRNFCVFLDYEFGVQLEADGWNVRWLDPRDPADDKQAYLQVKVQFGKIPPNVILVSSRSKTKLDEESVNILDWAEIKNVDLIIRPYNWVMHEGTKNEKSGVKGYLKAIYVTIVEDEFEGKYYDVPDSAKNVDLEIDER